MSERKQECRCCKRCGYRTSDRSETVCPKCGKTLVEVTEKNKNCKPLAE